LGRTKKRNSGTKNIKNKAIIAASIFFVIFVGIASFENNTVKGWAGLIYPGVTVDGTDISGMNKEQATAILTKNHGDAISNKKINVTVEGITYSLDYSKLKPTYDIKATVDEAFAYDKDLSLFDKFNAIKFSKGKAFELKLNYDDKALSDFISTMEKELNVDAVDATIDVNGGFIITPEKDGKKLDKEALKKELLSKIDGKLGEDTNILASMIPEKAAVTAAQLKNINAQISTFSTNYGSISSPERANNICLATKSVNGTVLMPGQTFSFNGAVGERTVARGYQEAHVIVNDKIDSGLGGGICQVSTTLYNACLKGNLKITERTHHTFPSAYVPKGQDATVDYGNIDFQFTNSYAYPLYIEGTTGGGYVSFSIYSDKSLTATTCTITNDVYETLQPTTQYINDASLLAGKTATDSTAHTGYKVKVYKTVYTNGVKVSQTTISDDYYKVLNAVVRRGTMAAPAAQPVKDTKTVTPPAAPPVTTPETTTQGTNTATNGGTQ